MSQFYKNLIALEIIAHTTSQADLYNSREGTSTAACREKSSRYWMSVQASAGASIGLADDEPLKAEAGSRRAGAA